MADYWKSQAKKYCEFCRCWLADNKPSVEFHEKGRKHKENVARKLRTISKTSRREQKEAVREDLALRRMESAALEAYRKDVEHGSDITSKAIQKQLEVTADKSSATPWQEVAGKNGASFYWNKETQESVWEPPSSGFLSLAEQQVETFRTGKQQLNQVNKHRRLQDKLSLQEQKQQEEEERAAVEREKMKARRVVEEEPPVTCGPIIEPFHGPYGQWKTVETKPKKTTDLQLPKQEEYITISIPVEKPEPVKHFKEKTISTLAKNEDESCSSTTFKKRKFGGNQKRNVRQRFDNE